MELAECASPYVQPIAASTKRFWRYADSAKAWNEIVVDGRVYVNGGGFDPKTGDTAPGMIALIALDGSIRKVADGIAFLNGMAVTPDNSTLIVA